MNELLSGAEWKNRTRCVAIWRCDKCTGRPRNRPQAHATAQVENVAKRAVNYSKGGCSEEGRRSPTAELSGQVEGIQQSMLGTADASEGETCSVMSHAVLQVEWILLPVCSQAGSSARHPNSHSSVSTLVWERAVTAAAWLTFQLKKRPRAKDPSLFDYVGGEFRTAGIIEKTAQLKERGINIRWKGDSVAVKYPSEFIPD